MEKIKEFLNLLFKKEQEAINFSFFKDKLSEYNEVSFEIKSYMNDETVGFGLPQKTQLNSDRFYKTKENAPYPNPRQLYKISHYQNEKYGDLWVCYVSIANPYNNITGMDDCFIVAEIKGKLKIIAKFIKDSDTKKWIHVGGDENLKLYNIGKLQEIERIMEPKDDIWSMEQYNKDI